MKKEIYYSVNANNELVFKKKSTIRSCECHLENIYDKFIWTGNAKATIPTSRSAAVQKTEEVKRFGIWNYYRIWFKNCLNKGEEASFVCDWPILKDCTSSSAFVSANTENPTKELIFHIDLGEKYQKKKIVLEEFFSISDDFSEKTTHAILNETGKYDWKIKNPPRGRHYRVRWSWKNDEVDELEERK